MLKLCFKDYLANRWLWLFPLFVFLTYSLQPIGHGLTLMLYGAALVLGCLAITLGFEDRSKTEALYGSLPLNRVTIVRGRYLLAGLLTLVGGAVVFASIKPMNAFLSARFHKDMPGFLLSVEGAAGFLLFLTLAISVYLPLYYKFGFGRGSAIFSFALLLFVLVFAGLERLAASVFHISRPLFTAEFLKDPGLGVLRLFGSLRDTWGTFRFLAAVLAIVAASVLVSLHLSIRFYQKREF